MSVTLHRLVRHDVRAILDYYRSEGGQKLADQFFDELMARIEQASHHPKRFSPASRSFRRANLKRFPYHFLYAETASGIRVLVVRHHRRSPDFGQDRH